MVELEVLSCEGCGGLCCRTRAARDGEPSFVSEPPYHENEIAGLPHTVQTELIAFGKVEYGNKESVRCLWLTEDFKCREQDIKPKVCRDFDRGGSACLKVRADL